MQGDLAPSAPVTGRVSDMYARNRGTKKGQAAHDTIRDQRQPPLDTKQPIMISQRPAVDWYDYIGDPLIAETHRMLASRGIESSLSKKKQPMAIL